MRFAPEVGTEVGGKYRIVRQLGMGGMAAVCEAEHLVTGKRCAIKCMRPQPGTRAVDRQRALHEARAACRIHHENVVDVYDVVEQDDAILLVMELLSGEPLSALLAREAPSPDALIRLLLPALRGLVAVHGAGVVHRDVKPQNIFLADEPGHRTKVAKIIDFGVSKVLEPGSPAAHGSGITLGTPRYMSYEQLLGDSDVDARTDVYAIGVILYEALTGTAPYGEAQSLGDLGLRFSSTVPAPPHVLRPELPEALSAVVMHAIARDRDARLASMTELIEALAPFATPQVPDDHGARATVRPRPPRRSLPTRARLTVPAVGALAIAIALASLVLLQRPAAPSVVPAPRIPAAAAAAMLAPQPPLAAPVEVVVDRDDDASPAPSQAAVRSAADALARPAPGPLPTGRRRARAPLRAEGPAATAAPRDASVEADAHDALHRAGQLHRQEF